jgi:phosphoribosylglycinamide formyltransferase-1
MKKNCCFASGSGTNAENIIKYLLIKKTATVQKVLQTLSKVIDRKQNLWSQSCFFYQIRTIEGKVLQKINGLIGFNCIGWFYLNSRIILLLLIQ